MIYSRNLSLGGRNEAHDLQCLVVLIRPKPRNVLVRTVLAQHVRRRRRTLPLGVAPGLQPN